MIIMITGPAGAGKTTYANRFIKAFQTMGKDCVHLDGDQIRKCWPNLGYTKPARSLNMKRIFDITRALMPNTDYVIISAVFPVAVQRELFRMHFLNNITEVFLPEVIEERPKSYYCDFESSCSYPPHIIGRKELEEYLQSIENQQ